MTYGRLFTLVSVAPSDAIEISGTVVDINGCGATEEDNTRLAYPVNLDETTWSYDEPTAELCECKHVGEMAQFIAMQTGSSNVTFTVKYESDDELCSVFPDSVDIVMPVIVPFVDLQIHDLVAKGFPKNELKEDGTPEETPHELDPGVVILCNLDDDNENGIPDFQDSTAVAGENDLAPCNLNVNDYGASGKCFLEFDPAKIRVWETADKTKQISEFEWDIKDMPKTVYLEAIEGSETPMDTEIRLMFYNDQGAYEEDIVLATLWAIDIAVDGNRDGEIKFVESGGASEDRTTAQKPYRFWVNDDDDSQEKDHPDSETPDHLDVRIGSQRDLEDFTRLWISFKGMTQDLKQGDIQIQIGWKTVEEGSPTIKIYKAVEPNGGCDYVTSAAWAADQISSPYGSAYGAVTKWPMTLKLSNQTLMNLTEENPFLYLLYEGGHPGKGQLVVSLITGGAKIDYPGAHIEILDVKNMYLRKDGSGKNQWPLTEYKPDPSEVRQSIIFVHGWRMSPNAASNFSESMFKRLWHRGFKGRFAAFRWNTYWSDIDLWEKSDLQDFANSYLAFYNGSEHNAWLAGVALKQFVNYEIGSDYTKSVVAHSMGNIVVGSAFLSEMNADRYVILQGAVPAACYDERDVIERKMHNAYNAFGLSLTMWDEDSPDDDSDSITRSLAYRGRLKGIKSEVVNFCLPNDYATSFAWEANNDVTKPPGLLSPPYFYNRNAPNGKKLFWHYEIDTPNGSFEKIEYFENPFESMPFACRSWGKSVGAESLTEGSVSSKVNLQQSRFSPGRTGGFGDEHSAAFNFNIQSLKPFYNELLEKLYFIPNP